MLKLNMRLVRWLFGFHGISTFEGYLMPNLFYTNNQFYFKQFSLASVHSLIVKKYLFHAISFSEVVLIQPIQLSISIDFAYT